jgi:hypothetical protein
MGRKASGSSVAMSAPNNAGNRRQIDRVTWRKSATGDDRGPRRYELVSQCGWTGGYLPTNPNDSERAAREHLRSHGCTQI